MNFQRLLEKFGCVVESSHTVGRDATERADGRRRSPVTDLPVKLDCVLERSHGAAVFPHANGNQSGHGQRRCLGHRFSEFPGQCEAFMHSLEGLRMSTAVHE